MLLEVLKFPDPKLRRKALPVKAVTAELKQLADNMLETMRESNGVGLAAVQVGQLVRLIVIDTQPKDEDGNILTDEMGELERKIVQPLVLFNPEVVESVGKTTYEEGCLSVPTFFETVTRADVVKVQGLDREGRAVMIHADGLMSICLQHEIDHLDGKLFIDRLSLIKSNRIKNRIKKSGYPTPEEARAERAARRKEDQSL